ncbi:thiamine-phosphate kinase [Alkalihalophilus pseudofirmus]|uniref:thiamine-phosphate kinase n=1 Tax=Alkalihalophilus pseudofirmus TaxID=79885 RepID=UPI003082C719
MNVKDEFSFISKITPRHTHQSSLKVAIGDDAAVYSGTDLFDEVICVDTMVEGIHFRKDTLTPYQIGKKALAVNLSDLAAMGAVPHYYLVSIAIPKSWSEEQLEAVYHGMKDLADQFKVDLIGGDTVSIQESLVITVTVIGRVEKNRSLLRSSAEVGDNVFVTGYVGGSAAGLSLLLEKGNEASYFDHEQELIKAHQEPVPQVRAGRIFAQSNERISLNDVSDGLASEANEIAEASQVTLLLYEEKLPLHPAMSANELDQQLDAALYGGEDFQLIGTASKETFPLIQAECKRQGISLHLIGEVIDNQPAVYLKKENEKILLSKKGYNHFSK